MRKPKSYLECLDRADKWVVERVGAKAWHVRYRFPDSGLLVSLKRFKTKSEALKWARATNPTPLEKYALARAKRSEFFLERKNPRTGGRKRQ